MSINQLYIPLTSLNSYFVDKDTALPLANGKLYFYRDSDRGTAKTVYQISGSFPSYTYAPLPNPVPLNAVGTAQNAGGDNVLVYAYPFIENVDDPNQLDDDLYYVVCTDANDNVQWTRSAVPHLETGGTSIGNNVNSENLLSNPEFSRYFFDNQSSASVVFTGGGTTPIAPDWDLICEGSGTVTLTRVSNAGNDNVPNSPSYYLQITTGAGITSCKLRQTFTNESGLWSGRDVNVRATARFVDPSTSNSLVLQYNDGSTGAQNIFESDLTESFRDITVSNSISDSTNTATSENSDVYIDVIIPATSTFDLTCLQVAIVPSTDLSDSVRYNTESTGRELVYMSDYFTPALVYKQVPSYLVGWDFVMNPAQLGEAKSITQLSNGATPKGQYVWDQTICGTQAGAVAVAREPGNGGISFTPNTASSSFYMLQYLDGKDAQRLISQELSVNINAYAASGSDVVVRCYLFRTEAAVAFPTMTAAADGSATGNVICKVPASGIIDTGTLVANWTEIPRSGMPTAQATIKPYTDSSDFSGAGYDYMFNGWKETNSTKIDNTHKFAIMLTFQHTDANQKVIVGSVSLQSGKVASRPPAKTYEQTLEECQYYFERSYAPGVANASATDVNAVQGGGNTYTSGSVWTPANGVNLQYKTTKRTSPTVSLWSPTGAAGTIQARFTRAVSAGSANVNYNVSTHLKLVSTSIDRTTYIMKSACPYIATTLGAGAVIGGSSIFHYQLDARIGVV